jgi:ribosomal protein S18 acetylase RimI-like enzyme
VSESLQIRLYRPADETAVVALWQACGLTRPWNDPQQDIVTKLTTQPELFLVGTLDETPMASAMVGFDGHRGWVYYLAVDPAHRRAGHGRALMHEAERLLAERGCPKLNLQVRNDNAEVIDFYRRLGYTVEERTNLGRRLDTPQGRSA